MKEAFSILGIPREVLVDNIVMLILTFHGSFLLCHCVMVMCVTIL